MTVKLTDIIKLFFREERKFYFFICRTAGFLPSNINLFREAFVHKSVMRKCKGRPFHNERLEYLGDAVLDLLVADILYRKYPDMDEGSMSKIRSELVSRHSLNTIALQLGIGEYLRYSGGIQADKTHLPGDALEAFVAAIYIDRGLKKAKSFTKKYIANDALIDATIVANTDYKSLLLQWSQKQRRVIRFEVEEKYRTSGGEYNFSCCVLDSENEQLGTGHGKTKKLAEQSAAKQAYENILEHKSIQE